MTQDARWARLAPCFAKTFQEASRPKKSPKLLPCLPSTMASYAHFSADLFIFAGDVWDLENPHRNQTFRKMQWSIAKPREKSEHTGSPIIPATVQEQESLQKFEPQQKVENKTLRCFMCSAQIPKIKCFFRQNESIFSSGNWSGVRLPLKRWALSDGKVGVVDSLSTWGQWFIGLFWLQHSQKLQTSKNKDIETDVWRFSLNFLPNWMRMMPKFDAKLCALFLNRTFPSCDANAHLSRLDHRHLRSNWEILNFDSRSNGKGKKQIWQIGKWMGVANPGKEKTKKLFGNCFCGRDQGTSLAPSPMASVTGVGSTRWRMNSTSSAWSTDENLTEKNHYSFQIEI